MKQYCKDCKDCKDCKYFEYMQTENGQTYYYCKYPNEKGLIRTDVGIDMDANNILSQWYDKQIYNATKNNELKLIEFCKSTKTGKTINKYIELLDNNSVSFGEIWTTKFLTKDEQNNLNHICNTYVQRIEQINDTRFQCEAMLNMCDTFKQKIDVLQKFKIIDNNYQIII